MNKFNQYILTPYEKSSFRVNIEYFKTLSSEFWNAEYESVPDKEYSNKIYKFLIKDNNPDNTITLFVCNEDVTVFEIHSEKSKRLFNLVKWIIQFYPKSIKLHFFNDLNLEENLILDDKFSFEAFNRIFI